MKNRISAILFATILSGIMNYSYAQENSQSKVYLGLSAGFAPAIIGHSRYLFDWGGQALYAFNKQYFVISYSRVNAFQLKFDDSAKDDDSNMDRIELLYGSIYCVKEGHKLLGQIYAGVLIGLSYNSIRYYTDEISFEQDHAIVANKIGIPFGVTFSNSFDHSFFCRWEIKYNFIGSGFSYLDYKFSIAYNLN